MNYSRAFSYVFDDKNWLSKLLIAGLISLIPIIGQFYLMGWMVEIVRRVKAGRTDILPTTHFTYFLELGLKLFVVGLIYSIPVIILGFILNLLNSHAEYSDRGFIVVMYTSMGCLGSLLTFVLNVAVAFLGTYGTIKLAQTDQIRACLDFTDAFHTIKDNFVTFILVELLAVVAGLIQTAGLIFCFIGIIFTAPYGSAVTAHLVGQLWDNLKPSRYQKKSYRGTVNSEKPDIVEEAPFTKVQDIVNNSENAVESTIQEAVIVAEAPSTEVPVSEGSMNENAEAESSAAEAAETEVPAAEAPVTETTTVEDQTSETAENTAEPVEETETAKEPEQTDSEDKKNDDLPSFE